MVVISALVAMILIIICFRVTTSPFLKMWEGSDYGVLTLDETGKVDFFTVKLVAGNFVGEFQGKSIIEPFNRKFFFYLNSVFGKAKGQIKNEEQEETLVLTLKKKDYNKALFKTEFPILIYSKRLERFITKEYLHDQDDNEMLVSLAKSTYVELQKFNANASSITRYIVDLVGKTILNPQSMVFWAILIIIVIAVLWYGWPVIQDYFSGAAAAVQEASLPDKLT